MAPTHPIDVSALTFHVPVPNTALGGVAPLVFRGHWGWPTHAPQGARTWKFGQGKVEFFLARLHRRPRKGQTEQASKHCRVAWQPHRTRGGRYPCVVRGVVPRDHPRNQLWFLG